MESEKNGQNPSLKIQTKLKEQAVELKQTRLGEQGNPGKRRKKERNHGSYKSHLEGGTM